MKFHDNRWDNSQFWSGNHTKSSILHELDRDILTLKLIRHILDFLDACV